MIALRILQGDSGRRFWNLIGIAIDTGHHRGVGDGEDRLSVPRVARVVRPIPGEQPVVCIELVEVDGEALRQVQLPIDWLHRPAMGAVAAAAYRDPAGAGERRTEHQGWSSVDFRRPARLDDHLGEGQSRRNMHRELVRDARGQGILILEEHIQPHDPHLPGRQRGGRFIWTAQLRCGGAETCTA